jgi:hypothetical protein
MLRPRWVAIPSPGATAITEFELVGGADPYFTNVDPSQNNVFYLRQNLRLFTATPRSTPLPSAVPPAFTDDSISGAFVLAFLNDPNNHFTDRRTLRSAPASFPSPATRSVATPRSRRLPFASSSRFSTTAG